MGVGIVPYSPQGKGGLTSRSAEQSRRRIIVDNVVQSFDSPLDEPVVNAVQQVAARRSDRARKSTESVDNAEADVQRLPRRDQAAPSFKTPGRGADAEPARAVSSDEVASKTLLTSHG
jgi:hypothetical protein